MPPPGNQLFGKVILSFLMRSSCSVIDKNLGGPAAISRFSDRICHFHKPPGRSNSRVISLYKKSSCLPSLRPLSTSGPDIWEPREVEAVMAERQKRLRQKLGELGIKYDPQKIGKQIRLKCPQCDGGASKETSFYLFICKDGKTAKWICFRAKCGWRGHLKTGENGGEFIVVQRHGSGTSVRATNTKKYRSISEGDLQLEPLGSDLVAYFNARSISLETLLRNAVMQRTLCDEVVIAFTYKRDGKLVSCNYVDSDFNIWQEKETERIFYGLDDIVSGSEIIIVESEFDKLSMEEVGYPNCLSIPNRELSKVTAKIPLEYEDDNFQYLWKCKEYFEKAPRIILATNSDGHGQVLAEELARRLGKERCLRVKWPMKNATDVCIDANEVLNIFGEHKLKQVIQEAEIYPIRGLLNFCNFFTEINDYYRCTQRFELGVSTGWRALDGLYNIVPGELTVITGIPNSGKSEWIDALMCSINENYGWTFALCSMENKVREHARKLLEKHVKKPFFKYRYDGCDGRMSLTEVEEGKIWLNDTFHLIRCTDDSNPSIDWILKLAKAAVFRHGVRGLVIDSYNELDHERFIHLKETEYVSRLLSKIKRFAQHHSCHVWFVAHPKQLQNWDGNMPNLYDVSGSAHFINKCDNGVVIHRVENSPFNSVRISVQKVRNKVAGRIGDALLSYDLATGLYHDISNP